MGAAKRTSCRAERTVSERGTPEQEAERAARIRAVTEEFKGREHLMPAEIARLRDALQMIADQTVVPELFPDEDLNGDRLQVKSAMLISMGALEGKVA